MHRTAEVVLTQSVDVAESIGKPGVFEARLGAVGSPAVVAREPAGRLDVVLQRLTSGGAIPQIEVPEGIGPWFATHFKTRLGAPDPVLGVVSMRDELLAQVWRHRRDGFVVQPPQNLERAWNAAQRSWLEAEFEPAPPPAADKSGELLRSIAARVADASVLVVFNVSTYYPVGVRHSFAEEVYPVLAHRLDLVLARVAAETGLAVIDVDRSIAEFGGAKAVISPATYSAEASAVIAEDAFSAIDELGLEGLSLSGDVMSTVGRIDAGHVAPGTEVSTVPAMSGRGLRAVRKSVGHSTRLEREARARLSRRRLKKAGFMIRPDACVIAGAPERRSGIYAYGGCDLDAIVPAGRELRKHITGLTSILHVGDIAIGRSDFILQGLESPPARRHVAEVSELLDLDDDHFAPTLFEPNFTIPNHEDLGEFAKNVIVLSIAPDIARTMYRHREHGYLFDPGGFRTGSDLQTVLGDLDKVEWFAANFQELGRIKVEESIANFARIITLLRNRVGAEVVVANALVVDPGITTFDYRPSHSPDTSRRREFVLGLIDLSRQMGFPILDIDTLTKRDGVAGMGDFLHYTAEQKLAIGRHVADTLVQIGLLPAQST